MLESVYEEILFTELIDKGLSVSRQQKIPVYWKGKEIKIAFRADLIVDDKLIIEIKSVEMLSKVHYKQLMTYLKITDINLGLLINFNESLIKNGIKRIVNNLS